MSDIDRTDSTIIVGAGVMGLTVAWQLARRGQSVIVLERDEPGAGATTAAGGMLGLTAEVHFGEHELLALQKKSLSMYPDYVAELRDDAGIEPGYRDEGALVVARDRDDVEALERVFDYQKSVGLDARWLEGPEVDRMARGLGSVERAVLCPDDHVVDTDRLCDALVAACRVSGVEMRLKASVRRILVDGGRARGVGLTGGRRLYGERTVVCAGSWCRDIDGIPEIHSGVVRPVRGQTVLLNNGDTPIPKRVVRSPDVYLVPRADGRLMIGSTMEEKGFAWEVTAGAVRTLLREAWWVMPGIDELEIAKLNAGFRPMSLDGRPLIGPSAVDGLHLATGHGRHGILLAPATGELVVDQLLRPDSAEIPEAFHPQRFS